MVTSTIAKRSFAPVVDVDTEVLILGSLPGEMSLAQSQYYANPNNKFWHLVSDTISLDLVGMTYEARLAALLESHIGLWDVVAQARRVGSLDSRIRDHVSNDLISLIQTLPNLVTIAFNGGTAAKIGTKELGSIGSQYRLLHLPSSSPAHAAVPYAEKLKAWKRLRQ